MLLIGAIYSDTKNALHHIPIHAWINKSCCFFPAIIIGFSALLLASPMIRLPSFTNVYNLFVIMSLLFLTLKVQSLSHQCRNAHQSLDQLKTILQHPRSQFFSNGCDFQRKLSSGCCRCQCHEVVAKERQEVEEQEDEEDKAIDAVMKLKKELVKEKEARIELMRELEEERKASASAADEAMAKIQWLQHEKALIEREARQYRAISEQKQMYDQEVIESLKWVVSMFEADRRCSCRDGGGVPVQGQSEQIHFGEEQTC